MHRIPSPNDVFFNYDPWNQIIRGIEVQNSIVNDPPTAYFTLISLMRRDVRAFHWNPFIASGVPGFGSSASAVLSPFVLLPAFALPLAWVYAGLILLKLNAAFFFAYLSLREERMGRGAAAVGAIIIAASGAYAVRWWWQATNATALYPALLWLVHRMMRGRRVPFWAALLIALAYALAGFPAAMLYGVYLVLAYAIAIAVICRRRPALPPLAAIGLAVLIAMPTIVPFVQFLRRSGYLLTRANCALQAFPLRHLALFIQPDRLGNTAYHDWAGESALGVMNNYVEATVYAGWIPLVLLLFALFARRARFRWFWFGALAVIGLAMFGVKPLSFLMTRLPLLHYSPLTRLQLLLPIPFGYLAASAAAHLSRRRALIATVLAALIAADLAVFAGRFYPFITSDLAVPPVTPTIAYLQHQQRPFRIAAFMNYLPANTSEMYGLEDIRSHFSSEAKYRRLLQRIDPSAAPDHQTVIALNSLQFNFRDPLPAMLGVRYYIEHHAIDIVKWTIFKDSVPAVAASGMMKVPPGVMLQRHVKIDAQPYYAIELPVNVQATFVPAARLRVTLMRGSTTIFERDFTPGDIGVLNKIYLPVYEHLRLGDEAVMRIEPFGMRVELVRGATDVPGDSPIFYNRIKVPLIFDRELPDGRLFRNPAEVPRFHTVKQLSSMTPDEFLTKTTNFDFRDEAVLTAGAPVVETSDADVVVRRYEDDRQEVVVRSPSPTFLASSEKLTPELRVTIDGRAARPVEINMLFAGVPVPAGDHLIVFSRRLGRGWWWLSGLAAAAGLILAVSDAVRPR